VLLPFRPDKDSPLEFYYQLLSAILISLQGFCVSFLFCFANHEVITAVTSHLHNFCPTLFTSYYRESHYAAAATTTRDIAI
jgi:calcitonin receptor-like